MNNRFLITRRFLLGILVFSFFIFHFSCEAQVSIGEDLNKSDYANPKKYEIGGITVSGAQYLDNNILITLSGLSVGDKLEVPGDKITKAIQNLWKQGLFENINISTTKIQGETIFLNIYLEEKPRLSKFNITGLTKSEASTLRGKDKIS